MKDKCVWLPVECDISGSQKITVAPTGRTTGIAIKQIHVRQEDDIIWLAVITTHKHGPYQESYFHAPVNLGRLHPGDYKIAYDNYGGGSLGTIHVPSQ